jgi:hypothetical protein
VFLRSCDQAVALMPGGPEAARNRSLLRREVMAYFSIGMALHSEGSGCVRAAHGPGLAWSSGWAELAVAAVEVGDLPGRSLAQFEAGARFVRG